MEGRSGQHPVGRSGRPGLRIRSPGPLDSPVLRLGETSLTLGPGSHLASFDRPLRARMPAGLMNSTGNDAVLARHEAQRQRRLRIAPVGMQTQVVIDSLGRSQFPGRIPSGRARGRAERVQGGLAGLVLRRPSAVLNSAEGMNAATGLSNCSFGVSLVTPVDNYRLVERAMKYGILFIVLLFTAFFLFETLARLRIHPLQYLLVGAALCLFYLVLLALSELLVFWGAYIVAAGARRRSSRYSAAILGRRRAVVIGLELVLIYGFLYTTLQLQDYALVLGSAGLFAALAVVMFSTSRVNWYDAH